MHGIIEITFRKDNGQEIGKFQSPSQTIGSIVRGYKIATIKKIKDLIGELEARNETTGRIIRDSDSDEYQEKDLGEFRREDIGEFRGGSTGELQFAPTAPTGPTGPIRIIKSLNFKIWQRDYYEHIIRDSRAYQNISNYIINNPKKWKEDTFNKKK